MKNMVISLTLLFALNINANTIEPLPPVRGKNILKFIAHTKVLRDISLYQMMKARCNRYSHSPSDCKDSVAKLIQALDFDMKILDDDSTVNPNKPWEIQKFVFAAFKGIFIKLLKSNTINDYLSNVLDHFNKDLEEVKMFNLWEYTLNYFERDIYVASGVMATLFQDTSSAVTHLEYIRLLLPKHSDLLERNLQLLTNVIVKISLLEEDNNKLAKSILFPKSVNTTYLTSMYHFFVPYFLTQRLIKYYDTRIFQAKEASIMLNLTYEFASTTDDYHYIFNDPETLNLQDNQNKLQDIYTGYIAANHATGEVFATTSFYELATAFSFSSYEAVTNYILIR